MYARTRSAGPIRVKTFAKPESAVMFLAGCVGRGTVVAVDDDLGNVPLIVDGEIAPGALSYLARLLSDDEARLLQLFGVNLRQFAEKGGAS